MFVRVQVNGKLQPMDRGELEDNFITPFLEEHDLGEVVGGGTMLGGPGQEIAFCDIELELKDGPPEQLQNVIAYLDGMLPRGSKLTYGGEEEDAESTEVALGKLNGLALYLNGTELPEEVYQTTDINHVVAELEQRLDEDLLYRAHWRGPTETALYFYSRATFDAMKGLIADFVGTYPLCQKSRIVEIT